MAVPDKPRFSYQAGDVFAVTLRDNGFALGLVARVAKRGKVLGYFFGPRLPHLPTFQEPVFLVKEAAIKVSIFGDLHLIDGRWPVVSAVSGFSQNDWPVPAFCRNGHTMVTYDDSLAILNESSIGQLDCGAFPVDGLEGAGYVEIVLTRQFSG